MTGDPARKVAALIEPVIGGMGFELVRVQLTGGQRPVLQIMADPADGSAMTVDHCAEISRTVSAVLDVSDPISGAYHLEVSSPGIDRPLTRLKDFARFEGFDARIELHRPIENRKRFKGVLAGVEDHEGTEMVLLDTEEESLGIPYPAIARAKLLLTDALIAAAKNGTLPGAPARNDHDDTTPNEALRALQDVEGEES